MDSASRLQVYDFKQNLWYCLSIKFTIRLRTTSWILFTSDWEPIFSWIVCIHPLTDFSFCCSILQDDQYNRLAKEGIVSKWPTVLFMRDASLLLIPSSDPGSSFSFVCMSLLIRGCLSFCVLFQPLLPVGFRSCWARLNLFWSKKGRYLSLNNIKQWLGFIHLFESICVVSWSFERSLDYSCFMWSWLLSQYLYFFFPLYEIDQVHPVCRRFTTEIA